MDRTFEVGYLIPATRSETGEILPLFTTTDTNFDDLELKALYGYKR